MTPEQLLERFFGEGNELSADDSAVREVAGAWMADLRAGHIGPVFLPRRWGGRTTWYGIAPDEQSGVELGEMAAAFIDASYGRVRTHEALATSDPIESALLTYSGRAVVRVDVPRDEARHIVRARLRQLADLHAGRPPWSGSAVRGLGQVLADFDLALVDRDEDGARALLEELRQAHHVSDANLLFLEVRLLDALGRQAELLEHPDLTELAGSPRPRRVTRALLEAAHAVHLSGVEDDDAGTLRAAACHIVGQLGPVAETVLPPATVAEARTLVVAALAGDLTAAERVAVPLRWLSEHGYDTARLRAHFVPAAAPHARSATPSEAAALVMEGRVGDALAVLRTLEPSAAGARVAHWIHARVQTLGSLREVLRHAVPYLDSFHEGQDAALLELVRREIGVHGAGSADDSRGLGTAPRPLDAMSWEDWLSALRAAGQPGEFDDLARLGRPEWEANAASARLIAGTVDTLTREQQRVVRLIAGELLDAHEHVLGQPAGMELLTALAELITLADAPSQQELRVLVGWVEQVAASGPDQPLAARLLDAMEPLLVDYPTPPLLETVADLCAVLACHGLPGGIAPTFVGRAGQWFRSAGAAADGAMRQAMARALGDAGLEPDPDDPFWQSAAVTGDDPFARLAGRRVGIYTLMRSVAGRAKVLLDPYVGDGEIVLNEDHVSTPALRDLAGSADVMVVVTAAAKHAATEAIEEARAGRTVIRVNSKGLSGLLRELSRWLVSQG